jgi:hypothetical protein
MTHKGPATIIQHCAVFGRLTTEVRWLGVGEVKPYAQYSHAVAILYKRPRKKLKYYVQAFNDDLRYITIEAGGNVLYDSRKGVPCDMDKWNEARAEIKARGRSHEPT